MNSASRSAWSEDMLLNSGLLPENRWLYMVTFAFFEDPVYLNAFEQQVVVEKQSSKRKRKAYIS